jgi:hypothetical protein
MHHPPCESMMPREPRVSSNLSVWVSGRDTNGNRFKQTAKVVDVSRLGGRLSEIHCLNSPGDIVQVRHQGKKAHFRIIWIDGPAGQAGMRCIEPDRYIWGLSLPVATAPAKPAASTEKPPESLSLQANPSLPERRERKHPRYRCVGGVEARKKGLQEKVWGRMSVIGRGGCYMETASIFRPQTTLEIFIGAYGIELRLQGVVCCSHPGFGMGIMFTDIGEHARRQLDRLLSAVSRRFS